MKHFNNNTIFKASVLIYLHRCWQRSVLPLQWSTCRLIWFVIVGSGERRRIAVAYVLCICYCLIVDGHHQYMGDESCKRTFRILDAVSLFEESFSNFEFRAFATRYVLIDVHECRVLHSASLWFAYELKLSIESSWLYS